MRIIRYCRFWFFLLLLSIIVVNNYAIAQQITYNRSAAIRYAERWCREINYGVYKDYRNLGGDCTNFASQCIIAGFGGNPFACVRGAQSIGINENIKGITLARAIGSVLTSNFCFTTVSLSQAKEGDIVTWQNPSKVTRDNPTGTYHAAILNSDKYVAAHSSFHCFDERRSPSWIGRNFTIYHFQDDDECKKCVRGDGTCSASLENAANGCQNCDPATGTITPLCMQQVSGRCQPRVNCQLSLLSCHGGSFNPISCHTSPGGDCPDDTFTVGTGILPQPVPATNPGASVGILESGFTYDMVGLFQWFNETARVVKPDEISPALVKDVPLLVVPTAGLYGMATSTFFKTALEEYVKQGGSVLVLSQQHGYEYSILPGGLSAYGWAEDQSCQTDSSYIDTWHPVLSGQTRSTPSLNVDGYFTKYPENSTILLRRTVNGQPAVLMYPYGSGYVFVTTIYTDTAFTRGEASEDEKRLIRDMVSWAKAPKQLPEIKPGESSTITLNVTNNDVSATATAAEIEFYNPNKNEVKFSAKVPLNLAPGQSTQVPVTYTSVSTDPTGIYKVKYGLLAEGYQLLTSEEEPDGVNVWLESVLQPPLEEFSGRFAVSSPPTGVIKGPDFSFAVNSDSENYAYGSDASFTITMYNNTDMEKTITAKYFFPHHYWETVDAQYGGDWGNSNLNIVKTITIPPKSSENFTHVLHNARASIDRLWAYFYDESGKQIGMSTRGFYVFRPSIDVSVQTDKSVYVKGDNVNLSLRLQNKQSVSSSGTVKVRILDSANSNIYENTSAISLKANEESIKDFNVALPPGASYGVCNIIAEAYDSFGTKIGGNSLIFNLPKSILSVSPILPVIFDQNNSISFKVENLGMLSVSSASLAVSLKDPNGVEIWNGQSPVTSLNPGQNAVIELPMPIAAPVFGNYKLTYALSYEDQTKTGESYLPNAGTIEATFDKPSYKIRENAGLTVALSNTGKFKQNNAVVTVSMPDIKYNNSQTVNIDPGQAASLSYIAPVIDSAPAGQHNANVTIKLQSGSIFSKTFNYTIPASALNIGYSGPTSINAGDSIALTIENVGGVDCTFVSEQLLVTDKAGVVLYQGEMEGSLLAGENKSFANITIPSQTVTGPVYVIVKVKNNDTQEVVNFIRKIDVAGLSASLQARTDKDTYLTTDSIASLCNIANGPSAINSGTLDISVSKLTTTGTDQFAHFLPTDNWKPIKAPKNVRFGRDGFIYILTGANQVLKLDAVGKVLNKWSYVDSYTWLYDSAIDIAVGKDGKAYLTRGNLIYMYDGTGTLIKNWGGSGSGDGLFNRSGGIAIASDGSLYVVDIKNNRIQKFDSNGNFIKKWGNYGYGNGQFINPCGIAIDLHGYVYVADIFNYRIQKFDADGNHLTNFKLNMYPTSLEVDANGYMYITSTYPNNNVTKLDKDGKFVTSWGWTGFQDGLFHSPTGITVGPGGQIYVADTGNDRVQIFDTSGKFLSKWVSYGDADGEFKSPDRVISTPDGFLYVLDSSNYRVQKFDSNGNFLLKWGSKGSGDGQFSTLGGIAIGYDGSVYIADTYNNRIQKFDSNGKFISKTGTLGSGDGQFNAPKGLAFGADNLLYVADTGNYRIQKLDSNLNFVGKWTSIGLTDIAITQDGYVYGLQESWLPSASSGLIKKLDNNGNLIAQWWTTYFYNRHSSYISVDKDGFVYISNSGNNIIEKYDGNGLWIWGWGRDWGGCGVIDGLFCWPGGVSVGFDGTVYVADTGNNRIQKMVPVKTKDEIIYQANTPIHLESAITQDYISNISGLSVTGKLYLHAELKNSLGQTVTKAEYPFYVINGNFQLLFKTDKKIYKPGESVKIGGEIRNLSATTASGLSLVLKQQTTSGSQNIYSTSFINVPANGSYPFTTTAFTSGEGTFTLNGKVTQNNATLAEITDQYEVARPKITATMTAPDVVGNEPFIVSVELKNTGKSDATINVTPSFGAQAEWVVVPAGEKKLLEHNRQISGKTSYSFTLTGDLNQTLSKTVNYGLAATVAVTPSAVYSEGKLALPVTITNTGLLDNQFTFSYQLNQESANASKLEKSYYLPKGASVSDSLYFDLIEGSYQLSVESSLPEVSASANFQVRKETKADLVISAGAPIGDLLPVTVNVANLGYKPVEGSVRLVMANGDGTTVWTGSQDVSLPQSLVPASQSLTFNINLLAINPGNYSIKAELLDAGNQPVAVQASPFTVQGPVFVVNQAPPYQAFTAGGSVFMAFKVKNSGNQEGAFEFTFKADDLINSTRTEWLKPGEEKELAFRFMLPTDLEEKDYTVDYTLKNQKLGTTNRGIVKYHLTGINLTASAALDRQSYRPGDNAVLTLTINQSASTLQNFFARINYNGFEEKQTFILNGSQTLTFTVPLPQITGEKLFYGIYHESGRSIHLNSLYIHKAEGALDLSTDKQVYNPGDTVNVSVTGSAAGELTLSGPGGFSSTLDFSGSATRSFALPSVMTAGTYSVSYSLTDAAGAKDSGSHPFDVAGIQVKVKEAILDKNKYATTDTLNLSLNIESNQDMPATVRTWVVDPAGAYTAAGDMGIELTPSQPVILTSHSSLLTTSSGIHKLIYGIYRGDLLLASGSEAFDVGEAMLLSLATDKPDYPTNTAPVAVKAELFGTASANIELFLDGTSIKADTVTLAGFTVYPLTLPPESLTPGSHKLKAVLTSGGLTSVKETSFVYGSSLPDLTARLSVDTPKGSTVPLVCTVINQGKTKAGQSIVTLYDGDPASGGAAIASLAVPALEPGASTTVTYTWNVLGKAGEHVIYALADSGNAVTEFIEGNNTSLSPVSLPNLALAVTTGNPSYKANEEVGIAVSLANLTSGVTYTNGSLRLELADPAGSATILADKAVAILSPSTETAMVTGWNTGSSMPGAYTLKARLTSNATELASQSATFAVDPTASLTGSLSLDKQEVIQGFPLIIGYTLTNNGNIDLQGGEVTAELVEKESGSTAKTDSQTFTYVPLLQNLSQSFNVEKVDIAPGDYLARLTAITAGTGFLIGEKQLKVLPPLEVTRGLSLLPRVLVLVGSEAANPARKTAEELAVENLVSQALDGMGGFYRVVSDIRLFREELRTGHYNAYILSGSKPLTDHLDEELRERVNAGDGLVLLNYEKMDDVKFRELPGVKGIGYLNAPTTRIDLFESPITRPGTFQVSGKARKVAVESPLALVAGVLYEGSKTSPAVILNPYGTGRVVTFTFIPGASLVRSAVAYATPQQADMTAATPFAVETVLKSFGAGFDLKVREEADAGLPLLLAIPAAETAEKSAVWQFSLMKDETKKLLALRRLPEEGGTFDLATWVDYLNGGGYQPYKEQHLTITMDKGLVSLKTGILNNLKALQTSVSDGNKLATLVNVFENILNRPTASANDAEKAIKDLLFIIGEVRSLSADTAVIRLDLDRLIRVYERKWAELQMGG